MFELEQEKDGIWFDDQVQNIVSFSGGRTSAFLVYQMEKLRKGGIIDNVTYVFMDTGAEHPETYKFIKNVVEDTGIDLVCLRTKLTKEKGIGTRYRVVSIDEIGDDLQPWRDMMECYMAPKAVMPACTKYMKIEPYDRWVKDNIEGPHVTWLGIRADEPKRLGKKDGIRYLAEISDFDKEDILDWWKEQPFDLELESDHLGNCVFCIKKGTNKIALAARDEPELAEKWIELFDTTDIRLTPNQKIRGDNPHAIYRGETTFKQVVAGYADLPRDLILARGRKLSGACTESCEVFSCETQQELF